MGAVDQLYNIFPSHDGLVAALGFTSDVTVGYGDDDQSNIKICSLLNFF